MKDKPHRSGRERRDQRRKQRLAKSRSNKLSPYRKKLDLHSIEREEADNMHSVTVVMVVVYFISCVIILNGFVNADLKAFELIRLLCLLLGISFFVPLRLYRKKLTMSMYEYILINLLGVTPILCALFFSINWFSKGEVYAETYRIEVFERVEKDMLLQLEGDAYQDRAFLRTIHKNEEFVKDGNEFYTIYFSDGVLGLRFVEGKRLH